MTREEAFDCGIRCQNRDTETAEFIDTAEVK